MRQACKKRRKWTSLVAQWLRIRLPMQGTRVPFTGKKEINRKPRLDSLDKDFKSTVLNILKEIKEIMDKRTKGNQENDVSSNREYQ